MSLNLAVSSAVSSLLAIERQMALASNNISNANVAGYTNKTADLATQMSGGQGTGVGVTGVSSSVDKFLLADIVAATSTSGQSTTLSNFFNSLQQLLGQVTSGTSGSDLSSLLTNLSDSLSKLAATPDDPSLKSQVVSDLNQVASALRSTSAGIQNLRSNADQEISDQVDDVNNAVKDIKDLNLQIQKAKAAGQPTADLEDQRMDDLQKVAGDIDVNYFIDGNGNMQIFTASNQPLLDSVVHPLSHPTASSISAGTSYVPGGSSGISGIQLNGVDITGQIKSGSIKALIDMRDTDLPNAQSELDNLASSLSSAINSLANQGTASPPPNSLTGTTNVQATDAVAPAANTVVRVVLTDSSGKVTGSQDVDISGATTVQDVLDDLNAVPGVTASIVNGKLTISGPSGGGIAISTLSGSIGGKDASSYFGLNDLISNGGSASTIAVNSDLLNAASLLPTGSLDTSAVPTIGDAAVGASDASIINKLASAMTDKQSFGAAGWLGSANSSFSQYAATLISGIASKASNADDDATTQQGTLSTLQGNFSSQSGVNVDEQTALLTSLQNNYAASAKVISTAQAMFQSLLTAVQTA